MADKALPAIKIGTKVEVNTSYLTSGFDEYQGLDGCRGVVELFTHDKKKVRIVYEGRCKGRQPPYVPIKALKVVD